HLQTLLQIKSLQAMRLSLDEIRDQLVTKGGQLKRATAFMSSQPGSAADYIGQLRERLEPTTRYMPAVSEHQSAYEAEPWLRITLTPDVELSVRRRGSRVDRR